MICPVIYIIHGEYTRTGELLVAAVLVVTAVVVWRWWGGGGRLQQTHRLCQVSEDYTGK